MAVADLRPQAVSIIEAIEAEGVTVYDTVAPDAASGWYAVVQTARRFFGGTYRLGGRSSTGAFRVYVQTVGSSPDEARWVDVKVHDALEGVRVTVSGVLCSPGRFEGAGRVIGPEPQDDKVYSGTSQWTYTAVPTT